MRSLPSKPAGSGTTALALASDHELPRDLALLDGGLVRRACGGDSGAFRTIFDRHAPAVRRLLRDLLGDAAAADEATQETFVRVHRRLDQLQDHGKLLSWLMGIARNVCFEQLRVRRNQQLREATDAEETVDAAPSPEGALLGQEADAMLAGALRTLPEERRTALLLRIDHGLGYEDIAQAMEWPLAKVKNEIHRARLQLRSQLTPYIGVPS